VNELYVNSLWGKRQERAQFRSFEFLFFVFCSTFVFSSHHDLFIFFTRSARPYALLQKVVPICV